MHIMNCNCANNKNGMCYGNTTMSDQQAINRNKEAVEDCPGYIVPGNPPFQGVRQGPVAINQDGEQTKID